MFVLFNVYIDIMANGAKYSDSDSDSDRQDDKTVASDNGQASFRRGVMTLVILTLLKWEDMYGYQLVQ